MGEPTKDLPPLPIEEDIEISSPVVKEAAYAHSSPESRIERTNQNKKTKKYSLTMFPQRIENASHVSLIFILLAVSGFAIGVGGMILMLQ